MDSIFDDFCVFILTYGRPKQQYTLSSLNRRGWEGNTYFICSDDDDTLDEYQELYGDKVIVFNKDEVQKELGYDTYDNNDKRVIIHARNFCFKAAKDLGYRYFLQFDDDYTTFEYKLDYRDDFKYGQVKNITPIFKSYLEYYKSVPAITIAMAQNGDFIGGNNGKFHNSLGRRRKAMNSFFCDTERPFQFVGRVNEDVNTYTTLQNRGELFLTIPYVSLLQKQTQTNSGGMTEQYQNMGGTYVKSFYTIIGGPSYTKIKMLGNRLHHNIKWKNAVPQIIREEHKK
jgi:hypothetical protein